MGEMSTPWDSFVARAVRGEPDEPFLGLLRKRLASGYKVVRVNVERTPKGLVYVALLSYLRELSKMDVPHSAGFTRWSLASGVRMASVEEEEERWAVVAEERFQRIASDLGADCATLTLLERLRALAPPRTMRALADEQAMPAAPGLEQARARREVEAFLAEMAADLVGGLHYPETEAAGLLDGALERWRKSERTVEADRPGVRSALGTARNLRAFAQAGGRRAR
jgi:hypothetical protein